MKNYRQLRARVQRLRQRAKASNRTAAAASFEVFGESGQQYHRVATAQAAAKRADHLAEQNPDDTFHVWSPDGQHAYTVVATKDNKMNRIAALFQPPADDAIPYSLISHAARDLRWDVYGALDLGLVLLLDVGLRKEVAETVELAKQLESEYQYRDVDTELFDHVDRQLDQDQGVRAQFLVELLEDVNWHQLSRQVDELFFGPQQQRYPAPYQGSNRGTKAAGRPTGRRTVERRAGFDTDESIVHELVGWIQNSQVPYNQLQSVERNLTRKLAQDRYDSELAVKGFGYAVDSGAKDYAREFGGPDTAWHEMFPKNIRLLAAQQLRDEFEAEVDINPQDYEQHVYKKHLPRWRERYPDPKTNEATVINRTPRSSNKEGDIMTRRISRRRRQRLANRVEQARSHQNNRNRVRSQERRAARVTSRRPVTKQERLTRRVASLTRLLNTAERELQRAERPRERPRRTARPVARPAQRPQRRVDPQRVDPRELQDRRDRVAEIRKRLEQERRAARPVARPAARPAARSVAPQDRREAAPKVIRRKSDGKLYVRVD